jgi:hypothetical protein
VQRPPSRDITVEQLWRGEELPGELLGERASDATRAPSWPEVEERALFVASLDLEAYRAAL